MVEIWFPLMERSDLIILLSHVIESPEQVTNICTVLSAMPDGPQREMKALESQNPVSVLGVIHHLAVLKKEMDAAGSVRQN